MFKGTRPGGNGVGPDGSCPVLPLPLPVPLPPPPPPPPAGALTVHGKVTVVPTPLSRALTVTAYAPAPAGSMVPEILPAGLIASPGGSPVALNVFGSAPVAVMVRGVIVAPSSLAWWPGLVSTGGEVLFTVQVKLTLPVTVGSSASWVVTVTAY